MSASLRVLTYNVYSPENPSWERRYPVIRDALRALAPDVVALQEVPVDQPDVLEGLLRPGYHFGRFSASSKDGIGGTLATRWPQRFLEEVDLRINDRSSEALPWTATYLAEVDTSVGTVVVAHHKPSWPFPFEVEREQQALLAAKAIEKHVADRDVPAIVLGDFDAAPDSASMEFWRGRRSLDGVSVCYQSAWELIHPDDPGRTFDLGNPLVREGEFATAVSRTIDYVLVRAGWRGPTLDVADCRRVLQRPAGGVWASDHYGVMADLVSAQG